MSATSVAIEPHAPSASTVSRHRRTSALTLLALFGFTAILLFLGMTRVPNIYDEGLVLTGALRILHGQLPHRDFYTNYGPAQFYLLAGLFKLFGTSVLVERLYDIALKSALLTGFYALLLPLVRRRVAVFATALTLAWLFALNGNAGTAVVPVSLLTLIATWLLLPSFQKPLSRRRLLALGAVAATATLFRYETGLALLGIEVVVLGIAAWVRSPHPAEQIEAILSALWPTLLAFVLVPLPAAIFYLHRAPFSDLYHDVVLYPHLYYVRNRSLPFPRIGRKNLDELIDYLPLALLASALYALLRSRAPTDRPIRRASWLGPVIVFSIMTGVLFCKGLVRLAPVQLYLCILPSILLLAILYDRRRTLAAPLRIVTPVLALTYTLAALIAVRHEATALHNPYAGVPGHLLRVLRHSEPAFEANWCTEPSPFTAGFCFQPDADRVRALEYLDGHTRSTDSLYVGLPHHDRIVANDNASYFGANRLPATRWSVVDPGLQNSASIQQDMILDLERTAPRYVVLDAEFLGSDEPNDSSKSTGVTLLDRYIQAGYQPVETFGDLTIYQKR